MLTFKMLHIAAALNILLLLSSNSNCQSLFDAIDSEDARTVNVGVNLPPKFLPGGDMVGFSLPEDTPVGAIVSLVTDYVYRHPTNACTYRCTG